MPTMTFHLRQRMAQRGITQRDIDFALREVSYTTSTPENSTCIVGKPAQNGKQLKVWIVGTGGWPRSGEIVIKSAAWAD